jgi:hypothetical protein
VERTLRTWPVCDVCDQPVLEAEGGLSIDGYFQTAWLWSHQRCAPPTNFITIDASELKSSWAVFRCTIDLAGHIDFDPYSWQDAVYRLWREHKAAPTV